MLQNLKEFSKKIDARGFTMLGVALHGILIFLVQTLSLSLETVEANQIFDIKQAARMPRLTLICFRFRRRITK